jgi:hypothetical protein
LERTGLHDGGHIFELGELEVVRSGFLALVVGGKNVTAGGTDSDWFRHVFSAAITRQTVLSKGVEGNRVVIFVPSVVLDSLRRYIGPRLRITVCRGGGHFDLPLDWSGGVAAYSGVEDLFCKIQGQVSALRATEAGFWYFDHVTMELEWVRAPTPLLYLGSPTTVKIFCVHLQSLRDVFPNLEILVGLWSCHAGSTGQAVIALVKGVSVLCGNVPGRGETYANAPYLHVFSGVDGVEVFAVFGDGSVGPRRFAITLARLAGHYRLSEAVDNLNLDESADGPACVLGKDESDFPLWTLCGSAPVPVSTPLQALLVGRANDEGIGGVTEAMTASRSLGRGEVKIGSDAGNSVIDGLAPRLDAEPGRLTEDMVDHVLRRFGLREARVHQRKWWDRGLRPPIEGDALAVRRAFGAVCPGDEYFDGAFYALSVLRDRERVLAVIKEEMGPVREGTPG